MGAEAQGAKAAVRQAVSAPDAPRAMGAYSPAIRAGNLLFVSGQIPIDAASGNLISGDITVQADTLVIRAKSKTEEEKKDQHRPSASASSGRPSVP